MTKIPSSEITDKRFYLDRRAFIAAALAAAGASALVNPELHAQQPAPHGRRLAAMKSPLSGSDSPNTWEHLTTYNNFYEFGTGKSDPALNARGLVVLDVVLQQDGSPRIVRILRSLTPEADERAVHHFGQWRFTPAMKGGVPVKVRMNAEVRFRG